MTISNYTPATPDFDNGYTVTKDDWNDNFNNIGDYFNSIVKPAIDALQAAPAPNVGAQSFFNARLTLSSGIGITVNDVTGATTLYLTPHGGNLIGLYDTGNSSWSNYTLSADISIAVPTAVRDLYDVYVYQSGGNLALELVAYNTQQVTNNPAAGSSVVCNVAATANFTVGDVISISDGSNQEDVLVTAVNTNVSVTVENLGASYTAPVLRSTVPTTPVTTLAGVPVKSGNATRRFVGTVLVINNALNDTAAMRCIGNYYNRVDRSLAATPSGNSYNQATGSTAANASKVVGQERIIYIVPQPGVQTQWRINKTNVFNPGAGIKSALNSDGALVARYGWGSASAVQQITLNVTGQTLKAGRHFLQNWFVSIIGGTAPITNVDNTQQVSFTEGSVRN